MNQVTNFMYYVYNRWSKEEAVAVFGSDLGNHIFSKWVACRENGQGELYWYAELDTRCRQRLVDRANSIYSNQ